MRCPNCFSQNWDQVRCFDCGYQSGEQREGLFLPVGTLLRGGEYTIGKVLGKPGGFGITYLAWDTRFDLKVAVKEYLPLQVASRSGDGKNVTVHTTEYVDGFNFGLDKFLEEAKILAHFRHPHIVRVMNFFLENGTAYMVMDYLEGQSLSEYLQAVGRITGPDAVALFAPVLDGVAHIHARDFIHRDIKPSNIYLTHDGQLILLDFGSARQALREKSQNMTAILSPGYAPWEQYHRKGKQGPWTDVYACAATLYAMVTGQSPPDGAERAIDDDMEPVDNIVPGIDAALANAISRGMSVNPDMRPQTAGELQALLLSGIVFANHPTQAAPAQISPPILPPELPAPTLPAPALPAPAIPENQMPPIDMQVIASTPPALPPPVPQAKFLFTRNMKLAVVAVVLAATAGAFFFMNGTATKTGDDGTYTGEIRWGKRHGSGTLVMADGSRYTSNWVDGVAQGPGELVLPNGKKYKGTFDMAKKHASVQSDDGSRYEGGFDKNGFNGTGKLERANGSVYEGAFAAGKMQGRGTLKMADGTKFEGDFSEDELHGKVEISKSNGELSRGEYKNGKQDGEFQRFGAVNSANDGFMFVSTWRNGVQVGAEKMKPAIVMYDIKIRNTNKGVVINDWGTRFPRAQIRYITYSAQIVSLAPYLLAGEIIIKFVEPNGDILRSSTTSPPGASTKVAFGSRKSASESISGSWGHAEEGLYLPGRNTIQFLYKGVLLGETTFDVY